MTRAQLEKFFSYLLKQRWLVFGCAQLSPDEKNKTAELSPYIKAHLSEDFVAPEIGDLSIRQIENFSDLILSDQLPVYSFKGFFVPDNEVLFEYKNDLFKLPASSKKDEKKALFGINLLDIKAINLYDLVFAGDPYYQRRRKNMLLIGYAGNLEKDIYGRDYEPNILEHVHFDIFLSESDRQPRSDLAVFAGSLRGQRILEHFGLKDYEIIKFKSPLVNVERMNELREKLTNHHRPEIWEKFGSRCIECGKCTIACPTCFCFQIKDSVKLGSGSVGGKPEAPRGSRERCWDSCYYQEFSEVAGGDKFLKTTAERIHFWYHHKFARIPAEFGIQGCVGCLRCHKVCPVGINIKEVLEEVKKS